MPFAVFSAGICSTMGVANRCSSAQGAPEGGFKVRRGGSWHAWPFYARCGFRNWNTPPTRYTLVGIRLVMDAP
jgi:formylglycine-generating enzyme required for sulfatase activity